MFIKNPDLYKTAWIDKDEVDSFIKFIETYIIDAKKLKVEKNKSVEYTFTSKEIRVNYRISRNGFSTTHRLTVTLNNYDSSVYYNYSFWTESQAKSTANILDVLKEINK